MRFNKKIFILASFPFLVLSICLYFYIKNLRFVSTDNAYVKIETSIISSQVNALVKQVYVQNNQKVKKGDVLIDLDKTEFSIKLEAAKANLSNAINNIKMIKSAYYAKLADLKAARADLIYYTNKYDRAKNLQANNAVSQSELEDASRMLVNATESINNAEEKMKQQLSQLDDNIDLEIEKYSLYRQAKAQLDQAQFNLDSTIITAPIDGIASNFYINDGSFASYGIPLFTIINPNNIWLEANFKETELGNIKIGQKAIINVDSFPKNDLNAIVESIARATGSEFSIIPAQNSSGNWVKVTQRIMVKFKFIDKLDIPLSSGMSANVTIDTKSL